MDFWQFNYNLPWRKSYLIGSSWNSLSFLSMDANFSFKTCKVCSFILINTLISYIHMFSMAFSFSSPLSILIIWIYVPLYYPVYLLCFLHNFWLYHLYFCLMGNLESFLKNRNFYLVYSVAWAFTITFCFIDWRLQLWNVCLILLKIISTCLLYSHSYHALFP